MSGGRVEHVVHETETKFARKFGYVICRPGRHDGEVTATGSVTCKKCRALDIPMDLLPTEQSALKLAAEGRLSRATAGIGKLIRLDYVTDLTYQLTRRGWLVAKDFTEGAVPWRDNVGIVHARYPLGITARCDPTRSFDALGRLTTEKYGKLRLVADPITCLACARMAR